MNSHLNSILRNNIFPSINSFNQVELQLTQGQVKMGLSPRKDRTYCFRLIKHRFRHRYRLAVPYIWCPQMTVCPFSNRLSSVTIGLQCELQIDPSWLEQTFHISETTSKSAESEIDGQNVFALAFGFSAWNKLEFNFATSDKQGPANLFWIVNFVIGISPSKGRVQIKILLALKSGGKIFGYFLGFLAVQQAVFINFEN